MILRPESSVAVQINEMGELEFACDRPGPVRHYTPEQLGIPRVVSDIPQRPELNIRPDFEDSREQRPRKGLRMDPARPPAPKFFLADETEKHLAQVTACSAKKAAPATREAIEKMATTAVEMVIGGEPIVVAPNAVMGTEPLSGYINKRKGKAMRKLITLDDATRSAILKDARTMSVVYLARQYKLNRPYLYQLLREHNIEPISCKVRIPPPRPIEIDPHREGSASALIKAINQSHPAGSLTLTLLPGEIEGLLKDLTVHQRDAFLAAGLKAALLAR